MDNWETFLEDYKCLYAKEPYKGLKSKIKMILRIAFSSNAQVLFLIRYRPLKNGNFL